MVQAVCSSGIRNNEGSDQLHSTMYIVHNMKKDKNLQQDRFLFSGRSFRSACWNCNARKELCYACLLNV